MLVILMSVAESEQKGEQGKNPSPHQNEVLPLGKGELKSDKPSMPNFSAWQLAWELGYTIAIPIVALALVGRWGDRTLNTSPWLLLLGVLLSIVVSSIIVYRKVQKVLK